MIRHFNIWPHSVNKDDLFEEQKIFIIYLMGLTPSQDDWAVQVDYKTKFQEIKDLKKVDISQTDIDLAKMQNKNINDLKKERLRQEKEKRVRELNDKFGIKNEVEEIKIDGLPEIKEEKIDNRNSQEKLWDMLQGKNLIGKK